MLNLSPIELRVLGSLIEKEITTPEYYPLSLNALVNACNQKSSRDPVMELTEADVRTALFDLEQLGFVRVLNETRSTKFEHLAYHKLDLRRPEIAITGLLLLRGPQTPAELRTRAERLFSFEDTTAVADALTRLAGRETPLAIQLARQPGSREARWMHLLGGPVDVSASAATPSHPTASAPQDDSRIAALEAVIVSLTERVQVLEQQIAGAEEQEKLGE